MIDCHRCPSYNRGHGQRACLKCPKYKDIQKQSAKRQTITIDILPQALLEQIADVPRAEEILTYIRQMPIDIAAVLVLKYYGAMRREEIAGLLGLSIRQVSRKLEIACHTLKNILSN
jgi:DNA-directed RNA polymerase specialized sigma24 family protein